MSKAPPSFCLPILPWQVAHVLEPTRSFLEDQVSLHLSMSAPTLSLPPRSLLTATLALTVIPAQRITLARLKLDSWLKSVYTAPTVWLRPKKEPRMVLTQAITSAMVGRKLQLEWMGFRTDDLGHMRFKEGTYYWEEIIHCEGCE